MTWNPASGALTDYWSTLTSPYEVAITDMTANITNNFNALWTASYSKLATPTSFTPVWGSNGTAPGIGNGSLSGQYVLSGKLCIFDFKVILGSTTSIGSGSYTFSLPVTASAFGQVNVPLGQLTFVDSSASLAYTRTALAVTGLATVVGVDPSGVFLSATSPAVPANADQYLGHIVYITA